MTKNVRVENADNGTHFGVVVETWDKGYPEGEPDRLAGTQLLGHPTAMTDPHTYLTSTRYLVVREATEEEMVAAGYRK